MRAFFCLLKDATHREFILIFSSCIVAHYKAIWRPLCSFFYVRDQRLQRYKIPTQTCYQALLPISWTRYKNSYLCKNGKELNKIINKSIKSKYNSFIEIILNKGHRKNISRPSRNMILLRNNFMNSIKK